MSILASAATTSTPFIDWGLLGKVVLVSTIAGVSLVVAFSIGLAAVSVARADHHAAPLRALGALISLAMVAVMLGALIWGLELILNKS